MSNEPAALTAPVVTVVEPEDRPRVDAAGEGLYRAVHRETVADLLDDLKHRRVSAVLLSVVRCSRQSGRRMAAVVREFPTVPAVALIGTEPASPEALLRIGNAGIKRVVDVRLPSGWSQLRRILASEATRAADRYALNRIRGEVGEVSPDVWTFFEALFAASARTSTVCDLADRIDVLPSTLMSRFFRAKLPAPKRYLAYTRLLRAARLFEDPGHSIADVANSLEYSSPQSFGRHVRTLLGVTAGEFRRDYTPERMLERFLAELVRPHRETLRRIRPLSVHMSMKGPPSAVARRPTAMRRGR